MPPLTRSYAMTDSETISEVCTVIYAIFNLAFLNARIAWEVVVFAVRLVLLRSTNILHCIE